MTTHDTEEVKKRARRRVAARVQRGTMPRAIDLPCVGCGLVYEGDGKTGLFVYHHYAGYEGENAVKVEPLCPECHRERHAGEGPTAAPLILRSIRVSEDVWAAVQAQDLSPNQLLRRGLGLDLDPTTIGRVVKRRQESRRVKELKNLAQSDVTARAVERDDIEYGSEDLPTQHIGLQSAVSNVPVAQTKVAAWRAGRKPLVKPKDGGN